MRPALRRAILPEICRTQATTGWLRVDFLADGKRRATEPAGAWVRASDLATACRGGRRWVYKAHYGSWGAWRRAEGPGFVGVVILARDWPSLARAMEWVLTGQHTTTVGEKRK